MTALLTDNLPLLAGAPNGIKKLRELILELAVRGKLVPQDPSDEPASELLKRIVEEKARLVAEGKIKKQKSLPEVEEEEKPYALPLSWKWVRFDVISNTRLGKMLDKAKNKGELRPYLRNTNVQWFNFEIDDLKSMRFEEHELDEYRVNPGDLVICEGGEPGRCAVWQGEAEDMFIQKALHRARPWSGVSPFFLQFCLKAAAHSGFLDQFFTGATIKHFSGEKLAKYPVPLPPLAEQHRIVAKVDELMALCDRLEAQQADAESAHAQLVQALLDSLTQATDFAASWQRLAEHFHTLFTTELSIDALKQTLLQLAVMGKLVPQDPSEEPASELLKRIAKEKARLVAEGKIRKTKQLPEITDNDKVASTPNGWESVRFGQVIELISGQHLGPDEYFESTRDGAIPYLTGPADFGETYPRPTRFTNERRATSIKGDILLTVKGAGVGKTNFVDQDEFAISRQLMAIRPIIVDAQFARNMLLSMSAHFHSKSIGIAIPGISREDVLDTLIGIPPLPEQHRIVAKVDQLMALCDQLKIRLTQARQLNEQLTTVLVEQAVA